MKIIKDVVNIIKDKKGENIKVYYPGKESSVSDYIIVVTAAGAPHMKSILNSVLKELRNKGVKPFYPFEMDLESGWNILDYGYFILHVFLSEKRDYYPVDEIWLDYDLSEDFN